MHQPQAVEARDLGRVQHGAPLRVGEVHRHADHYVRHLGALVLLGDGLDVAHDDRQQLLGAQLGALAHVLDLHQHAPVRALLDGVHRARRLRLDHRVGELAPNQALDLRHRVLDVHVELPLARAADEAARRRKPSHGWSLAR
mmetsp:Transcript_11891/g.36710  ORF Transcript_11891/g.36710 Transcript_11891/m.36710 type:complete len:142 (-) Transcript_11891:152-577(-)